MTPTAFCGREFHMFINFRLDSKWLILYPEDQIFGAGLPRHRERCRATSLPGPVRILWASMKSPLRSNHPTLS